MPLEISVPLISLTEISRKKVTLPGMARKDTNALLRIVPRSFNKRHTWTSMSGLTLVLNHMSVKTQAVDEAFLNSAI
jgi:hypothetical protein